MTVTFDEYAGEIDRLSTVFKNAYPEERVKVLFYTVEQADISSFRAQCTLWIQDSKGPPLGEQFREFIGKWRRGEIASRQSHEAGKVRPACIDCSDSGWLQLEMHEDLKQHAEAYGYPVTCASICFCSIGQRIKAWSESSSDQKDLAKSAYREKIHAPWYKITDRWAEKTYQGKSLEKWLEEKNLTIKSMPDVKETEWKPYKENELEDLPF